MSYAELPLIVTEQILRNAISHSTDIMQWKHQLCLISVCRSWRTTGLPLVYRQAYILGASEFGWGISQGKIAKNAAAHSNLSLILDTQNILHVRKLHIELLHPQYLVALAEQIHELFGQRPWLNVSELTLEMALDGMSEEDEDDNGYVNAEALAKCFHWYMPNVITLNYNIEQWFEPGMRLAEHLAFLYADQIVALLSNSSSVTHGLLLSTNLTTLDIVLDPKHMPPCIIASSIVSLKLRNVPSDFCWTYMAAANPVFDRLQKLEVNYDNEYWDDWPQEHYDFPIAHFPSLMSLVLSIDSFDQFNMVLCSGLWKMPNVRHLEINGNDDSFVHLHDPQYSFEKICSRVVENMPHIQKLSVKGFDGSENCSHITECLALGYANQLQSLQSSYPVDPAGQVFPALTCLRISASLGYSLDIVHHSAPTLCVLSLDTLSHGFSWVHFSEIWNFSMLETLKVAYDEETPVDLKQDLATFKIAKKAATVKCPRLKSVNVSGASYTGLQCLLAPGQSCWSEVTRLELGLALFDNVDKINTETEKELQHFGLHISCAIPNVRHLICSGAGASAHFNNVMYQTMISAYAFNLYSLQCTAPLPMSIMSNLKNIENLDVPCSLNIGEESASCSIQPQNIQRLQLSSIPANYSWSWLGASSTSVDDGKDCVEMVFNNLESLFLTLTNIPLYQIKTNCQLFGKCTNLNMPRITSLVLRTVVANPDMSASKLYLGCVESISLYGPTDALPLCGKLNSINTTLNITITSADRSQDFYCLTNSWFSQSGFVNYASLKLTNISFALEPYQLNWPQLTDLTIESTLRLETLVLLLHNLCSLEIFKIGCILADTVTDEVAAVENIVYSCSWIAPVTKSLKSLEINELAPGCVQSVVSMAFKYILLVAPALEKMYSPEDISFSKASFISQLAPVFPHLNNIIFNEY